MLKTKKMGNEQNAVPAAGEQRFAMADNMDNIPMIKRMWRAQWPEFSWLTVPTDPDSRFFQMFAPDISRVGYGNPDSEGNCPVYAIMCPQQGIWIAPIKGTLNIEVTVTQSGGTVNEAMNNGTGSIEAQMTIQPKIWFSPDTMSGSPIIKGLSDLFTLFGIPFPGSKATAIKLNAYGVNSKDIGQPTNILNIQSGMDRTYTPPSFAMHNKPDIYNMAAWSVANVAVEIGEIISTGTTVQDEIADWFNGLVMEIFNYASGNLLQATNVLSWNVWVNSPEEVYTQEWQMHADYWRFSLDVNHRSPEGNGRNPMDKTQKPFNPELSLICGVLINILSELETEIQKLIPDFTWPAVLKQLFEAAIADNCDQGAVTFL